MTTTQEKIAVIKSRLEKDVQAISEETCYKFPCRDHSVRYSRYDEKGQVFCTVCALESYREAFEMIADKIRDTRFEVSNPR